MSHTVFISDLHLSPLRQDLVQGFIDFCHFEITKTADALYILGDFVEFWIGDDTPTIGLADAFNCIRTLSNNGVKVFFQHGNRDFMIGQAFADRYGITLLNDHEVIDLYGNKTLLLHGDTLCTDDKDYQEFRALSRTKEWQTEALSKTLRGRIEFARGIRKQSAEAVVEKSSEIMDVNADAVTSAFQKYDVDTMIHGHTHRPAEHKIQNKNNDLLRVVLSDWHEQGQYYCVLDNGNTQFKYFDITNTTATKLKSEWIKLKLAGLLLKLYLKK